MRKYLHITYVINILYSKYKELSKLSITKTNNPIFKMSKKSEQTLHQKNQQMANKFMKTSSTLLVIREMQIKTTVRYHTIYQYILECLKLERLTIPNVQMLAKTESNGILTKCWWECKIVQSFGKLAVSLKVTHTPAYGPDIPILGIYPMSQSAQAAITKFHRLSGLTQQTFIFPQFWRLEV